MSPRPNDENAFAPACTNFGSTELSYSISSQLPALWYRPELFWKMNGIVWWTRKGSTTCIHEQLADIRSYPLFWERQVYSVFTKLVYPATSSYPYVKLPQANHFLIDKVEMMMSPQTPAWQTGIISLVQLVAFCNKPRKTSVGWAKNSNASLRRLSSRSGNGVSMCHTILLSEHTYS